MKIISHRGLIDGVNTSIENNPAKILEALDSFDCEIDLHYNKGWWLGHDSPKYQIDPSFLSKNGLWIHCKNLDAVNGVREIYPQANYFWHENDMLTITSHGIWWQHCSLDYVVGNLSVVLLPEIHNFIINNFENAYGVCTDFPLKYKK